MYKFTHYVTFYSHKVLKGPHVPRKITNLVFIYIINMFMVQQHQERLHSQLCRVTSQRVEFCKVLSCSTVSTLCEDAYNVVRKKKTSDMQQYL